MCICVFIAANQPLELVPWDEDKPTFYVIDLHETYARVRALFTTPNVYYAGAYEGCGCGFQSGEYFEYEDEEHQQKRECLDKFSAYLSSQLKRVGKIDLYACWEGDEITIPAKKRLLTPDALLSPKFYFEEKEYLQFWLPPAPPEW